MSTATSPTIMRQANAVSVLRVIRHQHMSRAEIARLTGLSKPTVNSIIADLIDSGHLVESSPAQGGRARPGPQANVLCFNARSGLVAGLDLGASRVRAGLADLNGKLLASSEYVFKTPPPLAEFVEIVVSLIEDMRHSLGLGHVNLWAAGLGVPGYIDNTDGTLKLAPGFENWSKEPLRDALDLRFQETFGCAIVIGGRVQYAMLAEHHHGAARDVDNAVYAHLGNGIGLGILIGGEVYQGANGFAGELGCVPSDDPEPPPPGVGAFEWAAGGRAYVRLARRAVECGESPALWELCQGDLARIEAPLVFQAAALGDDAARDILDLLTERVARGLATACCVLNPGKLIIGAGLARAGDAFVADIGARVATLMPFPIVVERTQLADKTTVLGGIEQALRLVETERFFLFTQDEGKIAS